MKTLRTLLLIATGTVLMSACFDNKDDYSAGIFFERPQQTITPLYANTVSDSIILFSYGPWAITNANGLPNSWVDLTTKQGLGNRIYTFPVTFKENLTGEGRSASFTVRDTDHPNEAYSTFGYLQYATRGNGALGSAADVKTITGSDGSKIVIDYDKEHRPTSILMSKNDNTLNSLTFSYGFEEMTIYAGNTNLKIACGKDYQPGNINMENDTLGYLAHHYKYIDVPYTEIFSFQHAHGTGDDVLITYKLHGQNLMPDSLHNADSLTYYVNKDIVEDLALQYSTMDNRCQSVDVNQLLLGIEKCDPYLLLGLYRYARNTSIISMAKKPEADITVTTTLNDNKSVASMKVSRQGNEITYTFEY